MFRKTDFVLDLLRAFDIFQKRKPDGPSYTHDFPKILQFFYKYLKLPWIVRWFYKIKKNLQQPSAP